MFAGTRFLSLMTSKTLGNLHEADLSQRQPNTWTVRISFQMLKLN